jgi:hypothetical protein
MRRKKDQKVDRETFTPHFKKDWNPAPEPALLSRYLAVLALQTQTLPWRSLCMP